MQTTQHYPLIIIGAGPIGLTCGIEAKKASIDFLILEKGCLTNSIYNYPANMTFFSTSEKLEIGGIPFVSNSPKPTRSEALEYYRRAVANYQLNINLFEEVTSLQKEGEGFFITTNKQTYTAAHIVISTGFYDIPYLLNVPGENLRKVTHYYKEPHLYAFQKVMVVGAQNSAIDAALETWRKGAEVTMIIRGSEVGQRVKYWVRPDILNRIEEGSIKVYYNSFIKEIRATEVDVETENGVVTIPNDWVLALTGYQPNLSFLQKAGIHLSDDEIKNPTYNEDTHETNVQNIFLAGVICGGMNTHRLFIENSREHAVKIMQVIKKRIKKMPTTEIKIANII